MSNNQLHSRHSNKNQINKILCFLITEIGKNHQVRKQYTIQLGENELVIKELDLLGEDDDGVYKLIGPVLVKQDLAEAKANVRKRIEYIEAELLVFGLSHFLFYCIYLFEFRVTLLFVFDYL